MADAGISYSHLDATSAAELRQACEAAGLSVWMDDAGIPVGREHWDIIEREFARASVIIALDTPRWQASSDCQREEQWCHSLGKWIVYATPKTVAETVVAVASKLELNRPILEAHARLAARVHRADPSPPPSKWQGRSISADARQLTSPNAVDTGVTLTPPISGIAAADLRAADVSVRRRRRSALWFIAILAVLAILSTVALVFGQHFSADALTSERRAKALELDSESSRSVDSLKAISDAREALLLHRGAEQKAALAAAITADKRMRAIVLPVDQVVGGAWAASKPEILVYTQSLVLAVNTDSGKTTRVAVSNKIYPGLFVAGADGTTAVYVDFQGQLNWVDLKTGRSALLGPVSVTSIDVSNDGTLWWGTADSMLNWAEYPTSGSLAGATTFALPAPAVALDTVKDQVAYLGNDAAVHLLSRSGNRLAAVSSAALHQASGIPAGGYRASVSDCDGIIYGSYDSGILGVNFRWYPGAAKLFSSGITRSSAPVCMGNQAFSSDAIRGDVSDPAAGIQVEFATDTDRYFAMSDPRHERFAELSPAPARLFIVHPQTVATGHDFQESIADQVVFDHRVWIVGPNGGLIDAQTGKLGATLSGVQGQAPSAAREVQTVGCNALVGTDNGLFAVTCGGDAAPLTIEQMNARNIRAGADGKHFIFTMTTSIDILNLDGKLDRRVPVPWAHGEGEAQDADISPNGKQLVAVDTFGHVHTLALEGGHTWRQLPITLPGGQPEIAFTSDNEFVVLASDNLVSVYNMKGAILSLRQTSSDGEKLAVEDHDVIVSSLDGPGVVLDERSLYLVEALPVGLFDIQSDGTLRGLELYGAGASSSNDATTAVLTTLPPIPR